jgi:hypothetical protein
VRTAWDDEASAEVNFRRIGLALDPNKMLPIRNNAIASEEPVSSATRDKQKEVVSDAEMGNEEETAVVRALSNEACASERPIFVSNEDRAFCEYVIEKYGDDYKVSSLIRALRIRTKMTHYGYVAR